MEIQVYYLDIQAITTLYAFNWLFMCFFLLFIHFSTLQPLSWKVKFSGTQKASNPRVFNLQASDWLHCEEETGAYYSIYYGTSKLVSFFFLILKLLILAKKKSWFSKNSIKFFVQFFYHEYIRNYMYICTICNNNFKFTLSLKLKGLMPFIAVPLNA